MPYDEFGMATAPQPAWWIAWYGQAVAELGAQATELGIFSIFQKLSGRDAEVIAATKLATSSAALDSLRAEGLVDFSREALGDARSDVARWLARHCAQADSGTGAVVREVPPAPRPGRARIRPL